MLLLALIAVPVVAGGFAFFLGKRRITPLELAIQLGIVGALVIGGYYLFRWAGVQDYETWNGRIASKDSGTTSCCHSYECNCRQECTGSGEERSCSRVCDTCYEHAYDYYYSATSTNDEQVYYAGCYTSGDPTPSGWSAIRVGEPTAWEHRFTNYVLADPDELIPADTGAEAFRERVPPYPRPRGWSARRFLFEGIDATNAAAFDAALDEVNADLGRPKEVNVIVVVTAADTPLFFDALRHQWLGGKKNDVVVVIGAPSFPEIAWARVMAWNRASGAEDEFTGSLAERIRRLGRVEIDPIMDALRAEISDKYERRPFSDFEYLMARARPPGWAVGVLFALGLALSGLFSWIFWRNQRRMRGQAPHLWVRDRIRRLRVWWRERRSRAS